MEPDTRRKNKTAQTTLMFHVGNRFLLGKGWLAELTGYYNGRMAMGQMKIASFGQLTAGIQKSYGTTEPAYPFIQTTCLIPTG